MARALAALVVPLVALASCGSCERLAGPEVEVARRLKSLEGGTSFKLATGQTVVLKHLSFGDVLVKPEGDGYTAVATCDADGTVDGTAVSYIGLERVPYVRRDGDIVPQGAPLPNLAGVLEALEARVAAFNGRNADAYAGLLSESFNDPRMSREALIEREREDFAAAPPLKLRVESWTVRVDREQTEVLETYRLEGQGPPKSGRARFVLRREGANFRFVSGLINL